MHVDYFALKSVAYFLFGEFAEKQRHLFIDCSFIKKLRKNKFFQHRRTPLNPNIFTLHPKLIIFFRTDIILKIVFLNIPIIRHLNITHILRITGDIFTEDDLAVVQRVGFCQTEQE